MFPITSLTTFVLAMILNRLFNTYMTNISFREIILSFYLIKTVWPAFFARKDSIWSLSSSLSSTPVNPRNPNPAARSSLSWALPRKMIKRLGIPIFELQMSFHFLSLSLSSPASIGIENVILWVQMDSFLKFSSRNVYTQGGQQSNCASQMNV